MNGSWTQVEIAGKPAEVYAPLGRPRFGLLYLHDVNSETLRENSTYTALFAEWSLACVCPQGGRCWWTDRLCAEFAPAITPERYLLEKVLPFFQQRWGLGPRRIGVFGIGMGGQGALRLAFKHPELFPVAAGVASALDYHELYGRGSPLDEMYESKEQCRQDTAILYVPPDHPPPHIFFCIDPNDVEWYRGNDRLQEKLMALGVPYTADLTTQAGGHSWSYFNQVAGPVVRFLYSGLEQESRRLL
jgi:pimeloyl-ACP methyl ester carboxylesterase